MKIRNDKTRRSVYISFRKVATPGERKSVIMTKEVIERDMEGASINGICGVPTKWATLGFSLGQK